MVTTLYNALQEARFRAETNRRYDSGVGLDIFHDVVGEDSIRELEEIELRELRRLKKRTIERYADEHESVANVVDGSATFYSYGEPIIEQAKRIEDKYRDRNFGFVKKSDFLGKDANNSREVWEAARYLRQGEIVNPTKFFRSKLILPPNVRRLIGKWNGLFKMDGGQERVEVAIGTMLATGVTGAGIGHLAWNGWGALGGGLGGYGLVFGAVYLPSDLEGDPVDRISKQRKDFENALNGLDSEVREHFPLDSEVKGVEVA